MVNNFGLLVLHFGQVRNKELLVLLGAVLGDLILKNFVQILEELVVKVACALALFTRETFLVNFFAIASEAFWEIGIVFDDLLLEILGLEKKAADFLLVADHFFLAGLALSVGLIGATHDVLLMSKGLRSDFIGLSEGSNILLFHEWGLGVATNVDICLELLDHVSSINGLGLL